jgi:hypothetical protein
MLGPELCWLREACTHLLQRGQDIRTIQELIIHKDIKTTMIDRHVLNRGPRAGAAQLVLCNGLNPYRRIRLSNTE